MLTQQTEPPGSECEKCTVVRQDSTRGKAQFMLKSKTRPCPTHTFTKTLATVLTSWLLPLELGKILQNL